MAKDYFGWTDRRVSRRAVELAHAMFELYGPSEDGLRELKAELGSCGVAPDEVGDYCRVWPGHPWPVAVNFE